MSQEHRTADADAATVAGEHSDGSASHAHRRRSAFLVHTLLLGNLKRETRAGIAIVLSFLILVSVLVTNHFKSAHKTESKGEPTVLAIKSETPIAPPRANRESPGQSPEKTSPPQPDQAGIASGGPAQEGGGEREPPVADPGSTSVLSVTDEAGFPPGGSDPLPPPPTRQSHPSSAGLIVATEDGNPPPPPTAALPSPDEASVPTENVPPPMQIGAIRPRGALASAGATMPAPPTSTSSVSPPPETTSSPVKSRPQEEPTSTPAAVVETPASAPRLTQLPAEAVHSNHELPPPRPLPTDFAELTSMPQMSADWVAIPNAGKRPPLEGEPSTRVIAANVGSSTAHDAAPRAGRDSSIEPVRHVVQRNENFWTISRLYYGSGRYYKALWAANSDRVSAPDKLVVGMTIQVPPPEALDRSLVEAPASSGSSSVSQKSDTGPLSRTEDRRKRTRPTSEIELALPVGNPSAGSIRPGDVETDKLADSRSEASYPTYQVRPHDTLRSIARDTLGDSRREHDILEMNRDSITDARHLTPGQRLILPEDAQLGRR